MRVRRGPHGEAAVCGDMPGFNFGAGGPQVPASRFVEGDGIARHTTIGHLVPGR